MAAHPGLQKSLALLRDDGRFTLVEKVEYWSPFPPPGHRSDLFGILDILAVGPGVTLGVQTTGHTNVSSRKRKILDSEATRHLLAAGWLIEIHGWGKVKNRWTLVRHEHITKEMLS